MVRHLENATVKETQQKIYKLSNDDTKPQDKKPSINVVMIDGLSRAHFRRALKKTTALLEWVHDHRAETGFQVFQFMRYSVVGRNSIYNLTPLVSGRTVDGGNMTITRKSTTYPSFDYSSWLWDHANAAGYTTMFADEQCPFTSHMTPWQTPKFAGGSDKISTVHHRFGEIYCSIMNAQYGSDKRCLFGRQAHEYTFDYLNSYYSHYDDSPKFSWSILYEAHEPSLSILPLLDTDLSDFIKRSMQDTNRITVLLSDHGMHYGPYIATPFPGKLEHTFPTLFFLVPDGFLQLHPEVAVALKELEQALVTAVDIYSILLHLIHWPNPPTGDVPEGIRNLLVPGSIKENRSCLEAQIPRQFCRCNETSFWKRKPSPSEYIAIDF